MAVATTTGMGRQPANRYLQKGDTMSGFTHIDEQGHVRMVDVTHKKALPAHCRCPGGYFHDPGNPGKYFKSIGKKR